MTIETVDSKTQICTQCDHCVYEVLPNFNVCNQSNNIPITIAVQQACPIGKW